MAYLNKIKILDQNGQVSGDSPFGFGIGMLREDSNGNIVYTGKENKEIILLQKAKEGDSEFYTLVVPDGEGYTALTKYIDDRDTFLKKVEYDSVNKKIVFTFTVGNGEIEDEIAGDTDSREEVISVPVNDFAVDADNIFLTEDLIVTEPVGVVTQKMIDEGNGRYTVVNTGTSVQKTLSTLFAQEKMPEVTYPSVVFETELVYKEVGTEVTPSYSVRLDPGSYTYGPATGITATNWDISFPINKDTTETRATSKGEFSSIIVTEGECCKVTATATYGNGSVPISNLEKQVASKQIQGSSTDITKNLFTGYRPNFYGFKTTAIDTDSIDSDVVRDFGTNQAQTTTPKTSVKCDTPWMQFFYAVPKGRKTTLSVKDSNNLPLTVKSKEVTVKHVGSASSLYTVFYINNDAAYGATTLTLTWG